LVGNSHVARLSPGGSPRVSEDEVVLTGVTSVSNEGNGVVEAGSARGRVEHSRGVELEDQLVGLNGDGDWLLGNGSLGLGLRLWGDVSVGGHSDSSVVDGSSGAGASGGSVWVGALGDGGVGLPVSEGVLLKTSIASEVSVLDEGAVNELLLGELEELSGFDGVGSFEGSN